MKKISLLLFFIFSFSTYSQVGIGTTNPHGSSILDITASNKGVLIPRMTTAEKLAITTPSNGLIIYDTDLLCFSFYDGTQWNCLTVDRSLQAATLTTLDCANMIQSGTLISGNQANGISTMIPYTGGNGGAYSAFSVGSTGVLGLTASIPAGMVNNGSGTLTVYITGTPVTWGTASFTINIAGKIVCN